MKLIYSQGACSLSIHIFLEEMSADYQAIKVSLSDKTVLESYNPKSYVPALILDDGELMTEATSLLQFLSLENDSAFLPKDAFRRAKCIEWLTFVSTELHSGMAPLFSKEDLTPKFLKDLTEKVEKRLKSLDDHLKERAFIMDNDYTVADMYALAILRIMDHIKIDLNKFPAIINYKKNLEESPVIKKTIEAEASAEVQTEVEVVKADFKYIKTEIRTTNERFQH